MKLCYLKTFCHVKQEWSWHFSHTLTYKTSNLKQLLSLVHQNDKVSLKLTVYYQVYWNRVNWNKSKDGRNQLLRTNSSKLESRNYIYTPLSSVQLFATLWTVGHLSPLSMGFSRQNTGVGCHALPQENFPIQGLEPTSLMSPALADRLFTTSTTWEGSLEPTGKHNKCTAKIKC